MVRGKAEDKSAKRNKKHAQPQTQEIYEEASKKRPRSRSLKKNVGLVAFCLILLFAGLLGAFWPFSPSQPPTQIDGGEQRAAIIDGLYANYPNPVFTQSLAQNLSIAGYHVEVFKGANVTIDLLKNIGGYEILILRLHSVIYEDGFLYIFSGEEYTESKYINEQIMGSVKKGMTVRNDTPVFAINILSLGNNKVNSLNGSTIILGGCNGSATPYVIQRIFERGVKAYVSWNGYVDLSYSDKVTLQLVKDRFLEGYKLDEAVKKVITEVGLDPTYGSELLCYWPLSQP